MSCTLCMVVTTRNGPLIGFAIGHFAGTPDSTCYTREAYWGAAVAASLRAPPSNPLPPGAPEPICIQAALASHLPPLDLAVERGRADILRPLT